MEKNVNKKDPRLISVWELVIVISIIMAVAGVVIFGSISGH